jgi:hypothetical protein
MLISPACHGIAAVLPSLPFAKVQYSGHIGGTENKELEREVNDEELEVPIFWRWRRNWRRRHAAAERQACRLQVVRTKKLKSFKETVCSLLLQWLTDR